MLNVGGTLTTAFLRALGQALVSFGGVTLMTFQAADDWEDALVAGGVAAFIALGFRGALEGLSDASRQRAGDVAASDVQVIGEGKA